MRMVITWLPPMTLGMESSRELWGLSIPSSVSIYNLWTEQNEIVVNDIHSNICTSVMFYNQGRKYISTSPLRLCPS